MSFGWDYPPGVSGMEYEINGPDREYEAELWCDYCDCEVEATVSVYRMESWWTCPVCDSDYEFYSEVDDDE